MNYYGVPTANGNAVQIHHGPKAMLANAWAAAAAVFPVPVPRSLAAVIGTRTWGGLIGMSPALIDRRAASTFAIYDTTGKWIIEGHGVDPDIRSSTTRRHRRAHDPQLERGVSELLRASAKAARPPATVPQARAITQSA